LYVFWTGDNPIPEIRKASLQTMSKAGLNVNFIDKNSLYEFLKKESIHPAYKYLNLAHRADYLRAYFMHHFGGGYCDIKAVRESWLPALNYLQSSDRLLAVGYREMSRHTVANIYQSSKIIGAGKRDEIINYLKWRWLQLNFQKLIGNGAFIFKPKTTLTMAWWSELNNRLDFLMPSLERNPAVHPKERGGLIYNGVLSHYPVPWTYLLGDILQPLVLKYYRRVSKDLPPPDFRNYQ